jgi:MoaA/NifB/PqqE/SkfB family radical SAM enzyme
MPFLSHRVRRDRPHPGLGLLQVRELQEIVDENPWLSDIELSNWGEILLNPDLVKIMAYAWKRSVNLRAENGVNLNTAPDEVLEGPVRYRFHSMNCWIDGASVETYSIYRRKGYFEKVISHIRKINTFKEKNGSVRGSQPKARTIDNKPHPRDVLSLGDVCRVD